jgi:hypothetical protein
MADMLDIGAAWLAEQQRAHVSREVTYSRGASSVVLSATKGQTREDEFDGTGARASTVSVDFIVMRADLILDDEEVRPATGDRITDGTMLYEVMGLGGEEHARDTDQYRHQIRIHTKFIGTA